MTGLRLVPYRELSKVAEGVGFHWTRREGSHNVFRNSGGRVVVIPDHGSQVIVRSSSEKYFEIWDSASRSTIASWTGCDPPVLREQASDS